MRIQILALFCAFSSLAFADGLTNDRIAELAHVSGTFRADCLSKPEIKEVKAVNVTNKTSESLDKTVLAAALTKELGVTISDKSQNVINARLDSKVKEAKKVKTAEYQVTVVLADDTADICKHAYGKTYTDTRK